MKQRIGFLEVIVTTVLVVIPISFANADDPSWIQKITNPGPGARSHHRMVFDRWRCVHVLFGGFDSQGNPSNETWTFDGQDWTLASTEGPSARIDPMMAFDNQRGRVVLFGGFDGSALSDTWEWDGVAWTQIATGTSPSARYGADMVFDDLGGVTWLFGGYDGGSTLYGDTWKWDGATSTWTEMDTSGLPTPSPRQSHRMAYDIERGKVVLVGGSTVVFDFVPPQDTWEWDGAAWTQVSIDGPEARGEHAMVYDPDRQRTILFGGLGAAADTPGNVRLSDTWAWDGTIWTRLASCSPQKRCCHAMSYDSCCQTLFLFGGSDAGNGGQPLLEDAWDLPNPSADSDGDGVLDCVDGCPDDPNKSEPGSCGCGTVDDPTDSDGDAIPDCVDNCPTIPNPDQRDFDQDGFGDTCDPDKDGDGIPNELDVCEWTNLGLSVDCEGRPRLDLNADCDVDGLDLQIITGEFVNQG